MSRALSRLLALLHGARSARSLNDGASTGFALALLAAGAVLIAWGISLSAAHPLFGNADDLALAADEVMVVERLSTHSALLSLENGSLALIPRRLLEASAARGDRLDASFAPLSRRDARLASAAPGDRGASPVLLP